MIKLNDFNNLQGEATAHWDFCHDAAMGRSGKSFATLCAKFCTLYTIRYWYMQKFAHHASTTLRLVTLVYTLKLSLYTL